MEETTVTGMEAIWTGLSDWITGIFGAIGDLLESLMSANALLVGFVILMPLMGIAMGYLFKFLGKRKRKGP